MPSFQIHVTQIRDNLDTYCLNMYFYLNLYLALSKLFEPLKKKSQKICYFIIPKRSLCNNLTILSFYSSQKARKTHFLANF